MNNTSFTPEEMWAVRVADGARAVKVPIPLRAKGEAMIRVERVGICGTDLALFKGYTGFQGIIGHEFAGVVVESESPDLLEVRVTASINIPKDISIPFEWETAKHNPERYALGIIGHNGAMAEYVSIPEIVLHKLPESVDFEAGVMAEPLAAAIHAVDSLPLKTEKTLLIGDGRLAQLIAQVLILLKIPTVVAGKNETKLQLMRRYGAEVLGSGEIHQQNQFLQIIEASGSLDGLQTALDLIAPSGTIVVKSTLRDRALLDFTRIVVDELKLVGSRCGDIEAALSMLNSGKLFISDLISAVIPLDEAEKAFELTKHPDTIKVQLSPHGN